MSKELQTADDFKNVMSMQGLDSGFEGMTPTALPMPQVKILEMVSPELKKGTPEYIPGAEPGMFLWPDGRLTKESKVFIVSFAQKMIAWKPNRGGFVAEWALSDPAWKNHIAKEDGLKKFDANGNVLNETMVYYLVNMDDPEKAPIQLNSRIAVLSQANAKLKFARKFNARAFTHKIGDISATYTGLWKIAPVEAKNEKGSFFVLGAPILERNITADEVSNIIMPAQVYCKNLSFASMSAPEDSEPAAEPFC